MVAHAIPPESSQPNIPASLYTRLLTENLPREHGFEPLEIEGKLPDELQGTLFRNGPGQFEQFGRRYAHPFEGDGAVTAIRLDGGRAFGACKLTASTGLVEERAAGRVRYGLAAPWPRRFGNVLRQRQKNTANTSVVLWQGRLFALMEGAKPTEIDPCDLSTIGEADLGGVVTSAFSAHPHRVASRRATYNFGMAYGRRTRLHLYELPDGGEARRIGAIDLSRAPILHDFIATDRHLVFFISPVRVDVPRILLQLGTQRQLFRWKPELGTEVLCVPIDRPDEPVRFTVDAFYQWHFANAFTREHELVIDYVRHASFDSFYELGALRGGAQGSALGNGYAHRATIDLRARTLRSEQVAQPSCEFPTIVPGREATDQPVAYATLDDLRAIGRLSFATGAIVRHDLPGTQRATEPLFVPRAGSEHDGWVLALCHDEPSSRAFLAVYDAARIPSGPIARAWFDHHVPITFHGTFLAVA